MFFLKGHYKSSYKIGYKRQRMTRVISTPNRYEAFGMIIEHRTLLVKKAEGKQNETCNCNC